MRNNHVDSSVGTSGRLHEIAAILAAGILRLRARAALPEQRLAPKNLAKSDLDCLELPGKSCSLSMGVNGFRDPGKEQEHAG